jgi:hypothetical protein
MEKADLTMTEQIRAKWLDARSLSRSGAFSLKCPTKQPFF